MDAITQANIDKYNVTEETRNFLGKHHKMFINGEFVESASGQVSTIEDPANGGELITVTMGNEADVDAAVAAARQAFEDSEWSRLSPMDRQALLLKLADVMEANAQTLAELESLDAGKAISGCMPVDIMGSIDFLRYMAGWATKIDGATRDVSTPDAFGYTLKQPVGVVGAIVPWNWPLNMAMWKLAAPLTVGCTVVLKPAEITPISMLYFAKLCQEAGLPKGVVNIVTGKGSTVGSHLAAHPGINKVSFTGSTPVGKIVGKAAVENITHVTLELGGKSPMVAFDDANIADVAESCINSVFFNSGQVCSAGSRLYVQRGIYEETVQAVAKALDDVVIGDPLNPETTQGPQISKAQFNSVMNYINIGKEEGARLVKGGEAVDRPGYYIQPTIFADTTNDMRIVREEIFGPVLVIQPFDTEEEAMRLANDSDFGLAASVFTQDISRAHRCVKNLHAGGVSVNTHDGGDYSLPFGGFKQSGIGKDMGPEQLAYFLETKTVFIKL
ncbi:aldehyde dehydrogenase family protein [Dasania sp. GY-MA-18]|uniref:Aldehyde dehydrogenase family protein n=1 Tax=Dasania phycosphaerae TaxID=2950436 RepID=A0A9J6RJW3_9GAMM|nr:MULTISPECIES: aldehyde dehydrogenase family protein [Dasania]MCR8922092.1 aldehyde dehydrogenase family protein [Dasania sp. GY-MA-18]MCZ0864520.1 aldehyde dehydrogenase family protein [Dasania phycosphaerae]MCZ0868248.1 aldehyde dehydrogenase family protein [Dasania phycosphaerae]